MKILINILVMLPLSVCLLFAQFKVDTLFDFKKSIGDDKNLFIRTITIDNERMWVSMSHNYADIYVFQSTDNGTNFAVVVKDTTPYRWNQDSMKVYEFPGAAIPYSSIFIDNDILFGRTQGIISKIDYKRNKFINDSILNGTIRGLEFHGSIVLTCSGFNVMKSQDYGKTWKDIAPDISVFGYDTNYFPINHSTKIIDEKTYYLLMSVSDYRDYIYRDQYLLKTIDGGLSWEKVTTITGSIPYNFTITPNGNIFICGIVIIERDKPPDRYYAWMIKSEDDGKTWKKVIGNPEKDQGELYHVKFYDNYFGVSYRAGFLYYTFDGGETWKFKYTPVELGINISTIEFWDDKTVLIGDMRFGLILKFTFYPSSIDEISNEFNLSIHPNPATDCIYINFNDLEGDSSPSFKRGSGGVRIYNTFGQCVSHLTPALSKGEGVKIDVSHLPAGVYLVRVGNRVEKFVKW